jgi:hypothetical protein
MAQQQVQVSTRPVFVPDYDEQQARVQAEIDRRKERRFRRSVKWEACNDE